MKLKPITLKYKRNKVKANALQDEERDDGDYEEVVDNDELSLVSKKLQRLWSRRKK